MNDASARTRAAQVPVLLLIAYALAALALPSEVAPLAKPPPKLPKRIFSDEDFVLVVSTTPSKYILARSSRTWRCRIRTLFVTNSSDSLDRLNAEGARYNESYLYHPDTNFVPEQGAASGRGASLSASDAEQLRADARAAFAPFLAHR